MNNILITYPMTAPAKKLLTQSLIESNLVFHTQPTIQQLHQADILIGEPTSKQIENSGHAISLITMNKEENYSIPAFSCYSSLAERAADWMLASILEHVFRFAEYIAAQKLCDWAPLHDSSLRQVRICSIGDDIVSRLLAERLRVCGNELQIVSGIDDAVLSSADVLCMHASANDAAFHVLSVEMMKKMKSGALILNCGSGSAVKEDDLVSVLRDGHHLYACIDQTDVMPLPRNHPLWSMETVRLTPQIVFNPSSEAFLSFIEKNVSQEMAGNEC